MLQQSVIMFGNPRGCVHSSVITVAYSCCNVSANWRLWCPHQQRKTHSQQFSHQGGDEWCILYCNISKNQLTTPVTERSLIS